MNKNTYTIVSISECTQNYDVFRANSPIITHSIRESAGRLTKEMVKDFLKEITDAPDRKIKKNDGNDAINEFYNCRYDIFHKLLSDFEKESKKKSFSRMEYDVPKDCRCVKGLLNNNAKYDYSVMKIIIEREENNNEGKN